MFWKYQSKKYQHIYLNLIQIKIGLLAWRMKNTVLPMLEIYVEKYNKKQMIKIIEEKHSNNLNLNKQCNK